MARPKRRAALAASLLVVALSATSVAHAGVRSGAASPPGMPAPVPAGVESGNSVLTSAEALAAWRAAAPASAKAAQPNDGLTPAQRLRAHLGEFEQYVEQELQRTGIPGFAVGVVIDGEVALQRTYGVKAAGGSDPVDADTLFQIASTSKAFTATMIATLVDDEVLGWDDKVTQYVPEFAVADAWATEQFTVRDALAHRSGLPAYAADDLWGYFGYGYDEILKRLPYLPLVHPFRTAYAYQNITISTAAEAAERVTGKSYAELLQERILDPAGMSRTVVGSAALVAEPNRVSGHTTDASGAYVATDLTEVSGYMIPAGGLGSSINDMTRWLALQLSGGAAGDHQVVSSANLGVTHTPHTIMSEDATNFSSYGLAWMIHASKGYVTVEHSGDSGVNNSEVWMVPAAGFGMVALSNEDYKGSVLRFALGLALNDLAFTGALQGDYYGVLWDLSMATGSSSSVPTIPGGTAPNPEPPAPLDAYVGTYTHDYFGDVRVEREGDTLVMYLGVSPKRWELFGWDGNLMGESNYRTEVRFTLGADGTASSVLVGLCYAKPDRPEPIFERVAR